MMGCEYYEIWKALAVFGVLAFLAASFGLWVIWESGYDSGMDRAIRDGQGVNSPAFADKLAELLDVQADGGDSPGAYVWWAMKEAQKERR